MLKVMVYAESKGVTSIDSGIYDEFGKDLKQVKKYSNPIFQ